MHDGRRWTGQFGIAAELTPASRWGNPHTKPIVLAEELEKAGKAGEESGFELAEFAAKAAEWPVLGSA